MDWSDKIEFRSRAKVPIINLFHLNGVECDVSIGQAAKDTSELVAALKRLATWLDDKVPEGRPWRPSDLRGVASDSVGFLSHDEGVLHRFRIASGRDTPIPPSLSESVPTITEIGVPAGARPGGQRDQRRAGQRPGARQVRPVQAVHVLEHERPLGFPRHVRHEPHRRAAVTVQNRHARPAPPAGEAAHMPVPAAHVPPRLMRHEPARRTDCEDGHVRQPRRRLPPRAVEVQANHAAQSGTQARELSDRGMAGCPFPGHPPPLSTRYAPTDSVCCVDRSEGHRSANSTPGTRVAPTRFARMERFANHSIGV